MGSHHAPCRVCDDKTTGNLQNGKRDAEEKQDEAPKKQERHQDHEDPDASFYRGTLAVLRRPCRRHGEENRNAAKRIDNGKQREEGGGSRVRQCAEKLSESVSGVHVSGTQMG